MDILELIKNATGDDSTVESMEDVKGEHLRKIARRFDQIAVELDAGTMKICCGDGAFVTDQVSEQGGVTGTSIGIRMHFVAVVPANVATH